MFITAEHKNLLLLSCWLFSRYVYPLKFKTNVHN